MKLSFLVLVSVSLASGWTEPSGVRVPQVSVIVNAMPADKCERAAERLRTTLSRAAEQLIGTVVYDVFCE